MEETGRQLSIRDNNDIIIAAGKSESEGERRRDSGQGEIVPPRKHSVHPAAAAEAAGHDLDILMVIIR